MKVMIPVFLLSVLSGQVLADQHASQVQQSRAMIKQLATELKAELQTAMKAGGPIEGIKVCNTKAQPLTQALAKEGMQIRRTSLKLRNAKNAPDAWELATLKAFEQRLAKGEAAGKIDAYTVNEEGTFRYMKAIPTGGVCVTCHGATLAPAIEQAIKQHYPEDQATGFKPGDIRGAFSVQVAPKAK